MFSSLASFLPALAPPQPPQEEQEEQEVQQEVREQPKPQRKNKDVKIPNETLVIVRPPPSKSNHPLNLQVQLVPPHSKPPSGVNDASATTPTSAGSTGSSVADGASLARTSSSRSQESSYNPSAYASTTSFTSVASTASSTSTSGVRRTIIPLYNLQAHNVMPNVIVDAGTDARIAKFHKRGIDLIDLASFEPVEVWGDKDAGSRDARKESNRISIDELGAIISPSTTNRQENSNWGGLLSARTIGGFLQPGSNNNNPPAAAAGGSGSRPVTPSAASSAASLHHQHQTPERKRNSLLVFSTNSRQSLVDSVHSTPASVQPGALPPSPSPLASNTSTPQPKRNIFNKLFNKRSSGQTPQQQQQHLVSDPPFSPGFTLSPAPAPKKQVIVKDFDPRSADAHPLSLDTKAPVPAIVSPTSTQERTPTNTHGTTDDSPISPTPTIAPPAPKSHGRNLSITNAITAPLKQTLKINRNRFSSVLGVGGSSANSGAANTNGSTSPTGIGTLGTGTQSLSGAAEELNRDSLTTTTTATTASSSSDHVSGSTGEGDVTLTSSRDADPQSGPGSRNNNVTSSAKQTNLNLREASPNPSQRSSRLSAMGDNGEIRPHAHIPSQIHPQSQSQSHQAPLVPPPSAGLYPVQQTQLDVINLTKTQQLALRPPVLGIQPTFVSASSSGPAGPSAPGANNGSGSTSALTSPRPSFSSSTLAGAEQEKEKERDKENPLAGQRALMYVWLVKKWLKKAKSHHGSGFLGIGGNGHDRGGGSVGGGSVNGDGFGFGGNGASEGKREREGSALSNFGDVAAGLFGGAFSAKDKERARGKTRDDGVEDPFQDSGAGYSTPTVTYGDVEVRFEWKRARGKGESKKGSGRGEGKRRKRRSSASRVDSVSGFGGSDNEADRERDREKELREKEKEKEREKERKKKYRMSTGSFSTATNASNDSLGLDRQQQYHERGGTASSKRSARTQASVITNATGGAREDNGEESDPEDSETPWVCTLKVRRVVVSTSAPSSSSAPYAGLLSPTTASGIGASPVHPHAPVPQFQQQVLRLKVGTLSPTPHHPKVVAMLKVPFPLPDVEVERMNFVKRKRGPGGLMGENGDDDDDGNERRDEEDGDDEHRKEPYNGILLTAEEIKDVICSTGLWLVVREGFGGVGKVSRKGDGWRIRA